MLPLDTLTCELVPNAIKNDSLSCSVPPLEFLDLWATNAAIATTVFTALLAFFAFMAWREQKRTLAKMEEQIVATARQTIDSRQVGFLVTYLQSLKTAVDRCDRSEHVLLDLTTRSTEAWMAWSMDLFKSHSQMRTLTQWWDNYFTDEMKNLRTTAESIRLRNASGEVAQYNAYRDGFYSLVGTYIAKLQVWQVDESMRPKVLKELEDAKRDALKAKKQKKA